MNHRNIVRYFHAWREFPPSGWQNAQDSAQLDKLPSASNDRHQGDNSLSETLSNQTSNSEPESPLPSFASIFGDSKRSPTRRSPLPVELTTPNNTLAIGRNFDKYLYIQMELCRRESLAQWLETRQPAQDIYQMFNEILQAVAHLHFKV